MKIVSKHSDYYDGCNYDHSPANGVYLRHTKEVPTNDWVGLRNSMIGNRNDSYELYTGLIGFCGKLYPYVRYIDQTKKQDSHIYSYEDLVKVREHLAKREASRYRWFGRFDLLSTDPDNAKRWFDCDFQSVFQSTQYYKNHNEKILKPNDVFLEHRVPYFAIQYVDGFPRNSDFEIVLNPCLKDFKFYKVIDAYTTFQEIEMYLNNVLVRPDDPHIDPVPDKIKAESHGFNKFSFRKDKGKKK